nr:hypothetical protein [Clostridia bacterium]
MKKKLLRLTEEDLNNIIKNSVNRIIKEICEIDDIKGKVMSSDWDLQDGDGMKYQQMSDSWDESDNIDKWDRMYFDRLMDDNYHNDYNGNVNDYWKEKENFPF